METNAVDSYVVDGTTIPELMDDYGRTEAERTVVLDSDVAEQINDEVDAGKHDSYADALAYVIERGFAEIKRTRDAQRKLGEQKKAAKVIAILNETLAKQPGLVQHPATLVAVLKAQNAWSPAVQTMLAALGVKVG